VLLLCSVQRQERQEPQHLQAFLDYPLVLGRRLERASEGRQEQASEGRQERASEGRQEQASEGRQERASEGRQEQASEGRQERASEGRQEQASEGRQEQALGLDRLQHPSVSRLRLLPPSEPRSPLEEPRQEQASLSELPLHRVPSPSGSSRLWAVQHKPLLPSRPSRLLVEQPLVEVPLSVASGRVAALLSLLPSPCRARRAWRSGVPTPASALPLPRLLTILAYSEERKHGSDVPQGLKTRSCHWELPLGSSRADGGGYELMICSPPLLYTHQTVLRRLCSC